LNKEELKAVQRIENIFTKTKYLYSVPNYYSFSTSDYNYILHDNNPIIAISKINSEIIYDNKFFYSLLSSECFKNHNSLNDFLIFYINKFFNNKDIITTPLSLSHIQYLLNNGIKKERRQ
jgi:hypothetical protein